MTTDASFDSEYTPAASARQARVPLYAPNGKVAAVIAGGRLTKTIDGARHLLHNPPAIALDAAAVSVAEEVGVTQIVIRDMQTGRTYRASIANLRAHGWEFDRGWGLQIAMRLAHWQTDPPPPEPETLVDEEAASAFRPATATEPDPGQLALGL